MSVQLSVPVEPFGLGLGYVSRDLATELQFIIGSRGARITAGLTSVFTLREAEFDPQSSKLSFLVSNSDFLINGSGTSAVFLIDAGAEAHASGAPAQKPIKTAPLQRIEHPASASKGDDDFLSSIETLPDGVARAGRALLEIVRSSSEGNLVKSDGGKFINSPDNFWTIKPQFMNKSLAITARDGVDRSKISNLIIKDDRPGYIRFKMTEISQVNDAATAILSARRRRF